MSEAWIKALSFAALPGAATVRFQRSELIEDGVPTVHYRLQSKTASGDVIGDERDYDLLKAAMGPLEALSEASDHKDLMVELDLETKALTGLP